MGLCPLNPVKRGQRIVPGQIHGDKQCVKLLCVGTESTIVKSAKTNPVEVELSILVALTYV